LNTSRASGLLPAALLLGVTAVWGWTFPVVKEAVAGYPPGSFLFLRFLLATLLLAPLVLRRPSRRGVLTGAVIGIPLACGYFFQTVGLLTATAADAGLLTGLFVIITPLFDRLLFGTPLARATVVSALAGLCGTVLLTVEGRHGLSIGDLFEVMTALLFALHTVLLGRRSGNQPVESLAFGQMGVAMFGFLFVAAVDRPFIPPPSMSVWAAIAITGAVASALAFWIQTFVQQRVPPARTAIILLAEPAFATAFAVWLGGERLNPVQWSGAALIFLSLISHELWMAGRGPSPAELL